MKIGCVILLAGSLLQGVNAAETIAAQSDAQGVVLHEVVDGLKPGGAFNIVTYGSPRAVKLAELGLKEAGLQGGPVFRAADEIRIFASRDLMQARPKARIWLNTRENAWWYHTGGEGSAEDFTLQPGEVMVIVTKASTAAIAWPNPLR